MYTVKDLLKLINDNAISEDTPIVVEQGIDVWESATGAVYNGAELVIGTWGDDNDY